MSRSGYSDDCDHEHFNLYRGTVARAMRGRRGQAFLKELLLALDAMPEKKLIANSLKFDDGAVCALGAVATRRGFDAAKLEQLDSQFEDDNQEFVAKEFGIATCMVREIVYMNDEAVWAKETPERRFERVREWVISEIISEPR